MDTSKIIRGVVSNGRYTVTAPIVKEDYGLYLKIEGVELPSTYEVDFSNSESSGTSVTMIGNSDGVLIPSQFIDSGKDIFAFLYHVGEDFGRTVYKFRIPNKVRPDRTNETPTPEEQSVIDQAISALNSAVAQTAQDVIDADASAQSASADADRAEEARTDAQNYATQAEQARDDAQTYANNASASATASAQSASQSAINSADAQDSAEEARGYASASAQSASASANSASQALSSAQSASASAQSASGYASSAQASANTASAKAQDASQSASTASQKATEASQSATNAQTYASNAESAKTDAQTAKTQAETARDNAVMAKTAAETAQGKAEDAQAAAESVAESIPSDYSQLSEDVTELKSELNKIIETEIDNIKNTTTYNWKISETNGSVIARSAQRSLIMACKANTTYVIKNTKGNRLVVGASSVTPYNGYTFTHYSDLSSNLSNTSFTTGTDEVYLMVNYYYTNTTYTENEALSALEVYSEIIGGVDNVARERANALATEISNNAITWINGKKISIIADSISTFDADDYKTEGYEMYYPHGDVTSVEDMWWYYVLKNTGATIEKNASYAGSRVTNTDNTKPDFYTRTGSSVIGSPDVIFVQLGTNDSTYSVALGGLDTDSDIADMSEAYFSNAYIKGIKALQENFPNATIVLLILKMKTEYANRIMEIAKLLGVSFVVEQSYTTTQGNHPNKAGMKTIANRVLEYAAIALNDSDKQNKRWEIGAVGNEIYTNAIRKSINLYDDNAHYIAGSGISQAGVIYAAGTYDDRCVAAYIPVRGLSDITVTIPSKSTTGTTCRYCWYDKNNEPITLSGEPNAAVSDIKYRIKDATTLSVPLNAYTIAIQLYYEHCILDSNGKPMLMVQSGNVYKGYEPSGTSIVTTVQPKAIYVCAKDSEEKYRLGCDFYCDGVNDEITLQAAMDACENVGTIYLAPGKYHIDSIPLQEDGQYCALQFRTAKDAPNTTHRIRIKGFDQTPMRTDGYSNIDKCAVLVVSANCYDALDTENSYSVIGVERNHSTLERIWNGTCFDISGVGIMIPGNQKKVIAFDAWYAFCIMMERCMATAIPTNEMPSVAGVDDCVGIRCTKGSNFGQESQINTCAMYGFGQGVSVMGEHYVLTNVKTIYNTYGFTFNWYGSTDGGYSHPNTLINCCSEMDFNYPYFGQNTQNQSLTFIDFNMEHRASAFALGGQLATELIKGAWRGTINYTIKVYGSDGAEITGNSDRMPFWADDGSGKNMRSVNDVHKQIVSTSERLSYAPNQMQRVYDTDEDKFYTYIGSEWVEG